MLNVEDIPGKCQLGKGVVAFSRKKLEDVSEDGGFFHLEPFEVNRQAHPISRITPRVGPPFEGQLGVWSSPLIPHTFGFCNAGSSGLLPLRESVVAANRLTGRCKVCLWQIARPTVR